MQLHAEQEALWKKRREVVGPPATRCGRGRPLENAEYIYRKKLRELDRVHTPPAKNACRELKIVDRPPDGTAQVFFGAWVTLETASGDETVYRIVGADGIRSQAQLDQHRFTKWRAPAQAPGGRRDRSRHTRRDGWNWSSHDQLQRTRASLDRPVGGQGVNQSNRTPQPPGRRH